jgi:hypothetical protein
MYALGRLLRQMAPAVLLGFVAYAAGAYYLGAAPPVRTAALLLLVLVVLRRLEGVGRDLESGDLLPVLADRLLFDRRPDQHLSGQIDGVPQGQRQDRPHGKGG